jgi:hypothetical protein
MMKTPAKPVKPVARGGQPLPPGAHLVPGARATEAAKGAPVREPKTIAVKDHHSESGGKEHRIPQGVRVANNRTISKR